MASCSTECASGSSASSSGSARSSASRASAYAGLREALRSKDGRGLSAEEIDNSVALTSQRLELVQAMLADSKTEAYAAEAMVKDAAVKFDAGENTAMVAACAKYYASEMVGRVADRAVQIHGGAGYINEYAVERFYRDVRLFRIYEGTSQIQRMIIARELIARGDLHP